MRAASLLSCALVFRHVLAFPVTRGDIDFPNAVPDLPDAVPLPLSEAQVNEWESADPPSAINPIYINQTDPAIWLKRADSGPLYGSSGLPQITDVHQTTNPSCGFASSLAAVVNVASGWITSKITYTGGVDPASKATVTMYDPKSLAPKPFTVTCAETATKSDIDPATDVWWPGLYDHASVDLGMSNTNGALGPILPSDALQAITGLKAQGTQINGDQEQLWGILVKQAEKKTPMVLQTKSGGSGTLVHGHAYAVLGTSGTGADRKVTLYNPWGSQVTEPLPAIIGDTYYAWYLSNYDTWTGGDAPKEQPSTTQPPAPTTTPAPKPTVVNAAVDAKPNNDKVVWVTEVVTVVVHV